MGDKLVCHCSKLVRMSVELPVGALRCMMDSRLPGAVLALHCDCG